MNKEALFLVFHGFDPNNGISKKITYQIKALNACGIHTHLCYMDEINNKRRMVDNQIIADYGTGIKSKILKRTEFSSIVKYAIKKNITFVYIRSNHNANPFTINMIKNLFNNWSALHFCKLLCRFYDAHCRNDYNCNKWSKDSDCGNGNQLEV